MKKLIVMLLCLSLLICLASCTDPTANGTEQSSLQATEATNTPTTATPPAATTAATANGDIELPRITF